MARKALKAHWEARIEKENLFQNLKLKNYQTARVKPGAENVKAEANQRSEDKKNPASLASKSP